MAFGTSRIFKSTDEGAPQLLNNTSSFCTVLKAVLVDGYGTTAPLGWEHIFSNGSNKLVVRPSYTPYVRPFLRFEQSSGAVVNVKAYSSMYDIDRGAEQKPETHGLYLHLFHTFSSLVKWIIIGDEAGIYIFCMRQSGLQAYTWITYLGALNMFDVANKFNFVLSGKPSTVSDHEYMRISTNNISNGIFRLLRNPYMTRDSTQLMIADTFYKTSPRIGSSSVYGAQLLSRIMLIFLDYNLLAGVLPGMYMHITGSSVQESPTADNAAKCYPTKDGGMICSIYHRSVVAQSNNNVYALAYEDYPYAIKIGKGFRNVW